MLTAIPCTLMRGGTSKGLYFHERDLPADREPRDRVLLAAMGSPDVRQIDGVGGAHPLTSKVAVIGASTRADADVDYLFLQVVVDKAAGQRQPELRQHPRGRRTVGDRERPGAGRGPTRRRAHSHGQHRQHRGGARADAGWRGRVRRRRAHRRCARHGGRDPDRVPRRRGLELRRAAADRLGASTSSRARRDLHRQRHAGGRAARGRCRRDAATNRRSNSKAIAALKARVEKHSPGGRAAHESRRRARRRRCRRCAWSRRRATGGAISTRTFIPHRVHEAIGVLGAVSVATACVLPGSVARRHRATRRSGAAHQLEVEHPTGFFTVDMEVEIDGAASKVKRAALLRTARKLMRGEVFVPATRLEARVSASRICLIGFGEVGQTLADGPARARRSQICPPGTFCSRIRQAARAAASAPACCARAR